MRPSRLWPEPTSRRSEEHTSELQSQSNLVCRLLLEKKNAVDTLHGALALLGYADRLIDRDHLTLFITIEPAYFRRQAHTVLRARPPRLRALYTGPA